MALKRKFQEEDITEERILDSDLDKLLFEDEDNLPAASKHSEACFIWNYAIIYGEN
jgi:hypothetical protein